MGRRTARMSDAANIHDVALLLSINITSLFVKYYILNISYNLLKLNILVVS